MHPDKPDLTCQEAETLFSRFLDNDLEGAERAGFETHLASCPRCREGFAQFKEALSALHAYEAPPVARDYIDSLFDALPPSQRRSRTWPLWLAWSTAAAAAIVAFIALLSRQESRTILVPMEHPVIVNKVVERVVEKEVPLPTPVEVFVPTPVAVALKEGGMKVVRGDEVLTVAAGEEIVFHEGDEILLASLPPVKIDLDFEPLAYALSRTADAVQAAAGRWAEAALVVASKDESLVPSTELTPPAPASPVALVWEPDGTVVLETSGPDREVVPQLIALLDHENHQVSAVAWGRLKSIQERLYREYGISAPRSSPLPEQKEHSAWSSVTNLFGTGKEEVTYSQTLPVSESWQKWWQINREVVSLLARTRGK